MLPLRLRLPPKERGRKTEGGFYLVRSMGKDGGDHQSVCLEGTEDRRRGAHPDAQL